VTIHVCDMQFQQVCGVYIVVSPDNHFIYVGMSTVLPHRIQSHKDGSVKGWASDHHCTKLVYYEFTEIEEQALLREKEIKGWTRQKKAAIVTLRNPEWKDLHEELIGMVVGY
jgi:putative endonuclease